MNTSEDKTVTVTLTDEEILIVKKNASLAEIGGRSHIRSDDRMNKLSEDQITAQAGEAALSKFLTGSIDRYVETRAERNKNPLVGDNGKDLKGFNVDIKTSRMRYGDDRLYNLWVRQREYHASVYYVLGLMYPEVNSIVILAGYVKGSDMKWVDDKYEVRQDLLIGMKSKKTA